MGRVVIILIAKGFGFLVGTLSEIAWDFALVLAGISILAHISGWDIIVEKDAILIMISMGVLITQISHYFYKWLDVID